MSKLPRLLPLIAVAIGGVVAVRAVGVAPELFTGARAWAEEAVPAAALAGTPAGAAAAVAVCALTPEQLAQQAGISPAELRIIQSLSQRRTELDARDQDFATMLPLMTAADQKLDAKLADMNRIKAEIQAMLGQVDEKQKAEIDRLVQVYTAMRPREAARVFASLDDKVRLPVAAAMRPRSLAAVMAQMEPAGARDLTEKLARRFEAQQQLAAAAAAASAPVAAADTARPAAATVPAANTPAPAAATPPPAAAGAAPTASPAATPPAARPATRPANRPAARRPAPRPAAARPAATPPTAQPAGPQPYQAPPAAAARPPAPTAAAPTPAQPRQSVQ